MNFLFEELPCPSWIYDVSTLYFLAVNRAAIERYGYSQEEFLGMRVTQIRPAEDVTAWLEDVASVDGSIQDSAIRRHRAKDGSLLASRTVSRQIRHDDRPARLVVVHDIPEQGLAQQAQGSSEKLLRSVWDNAAEAMRITDRYGTVVRLNEACSRLTGFSKEEMEGRPFWMVYPDKDQATICARYLERVEKGSFAPVAEHKVTFRNGRTCWIELSNSVLHIAEGPCILTISRDITERKLSQERLRTTLAELECAKQQSDAANRSKSAFLANTSHEIRTPMNGILGLADLVLQEQDEEKRRGYLRHLKTSAEGLMAVLNDVLDFSKIEAQHMRIEQTPFAIRDCVQSAVDTLAAPALSKGLDITCHISGDLPPAVLGDSVRVRQILLNLIGNAVKFTAGGYVRVSVAPAGESIRFTIEDSGIGITAEQQQKIFHPFEQADISTTRGYGGTGLGLSIVASLVKLMNGNISVESQVGIGTSFYVDLSLPAAREAAPAPAAAPVRMDFGPLEILVAEDHPINQLVIARLLEKHGHHVTLVADGGSALAAIGQRVYDLVLMDVQMPVMDGLEATSAIRARRRRHRHSPSGNRIHRPRHARRSGEVARRRG